MPVIAREMVGRDDLPVVRVENAALTLDVVPQLGGKLLNLIDRQTGRNLLWRNPAIAPKRVAPGSNFDDHFAGGWDDVFPNAAECTDASGRALPHMGEIWTLPLDHVIHATPSEVRVELSGRTPVTSARWSRTVRVIGDEPIVELITEVENLAEVPLDFAWGSHATLSIQPGYRLDIPAVKGRVLEGEGGLLGTVGESFSYPDVDDPRFGGGIRTVLDESVRSYALYTYADIQAGWVAATDPEARRGFGLVFDAAVSRSAWQWTVYGGFREWYHVALEAWTAPHLELPDAIGDGTARRLLPGETFSSRMRGVIFGGVRGVRDLTWDGRVTGTG